MAPKPMTLIWAILAIALASSAYAQRGVNYARNLAQDDPARSVWFESASAHETIIDAAADTGQLINLSGANDGTTTGTLAASGQPAIPRELFFATSDNSGSTLSAIFTVTYTLYDGSSRTDTVTLTGSNTYALPYPAVAVGDFNVVVANSAASDKVVAGFRSIHVPGTWPNSASDIIVERYDGDGPSTAATVPQEGFILPDTSEHAGFTSAVFTVLVRTDATVTAKTNRLNRVGSSATSSITP